MHMIARLLSVDLHGALSEARELDATRGRRAAVGHEPYVAAGVRCPPLPVEIKPAAVRPAAFAW
jgi:hypothetical protein